MEVSEHSLVINAIQPLDSTRRCYRMIGGVLVERTIKEVLPAVQQNKEGIEVVISRLMKLWRGRRRSLLILKQSTRFGSGKMMGVPWMIIARKKDLRREFLLVLQMLNDFGMFFGSSLLWIRTGDEGGKGEKAEAPAVFGGRR